MSHFTPQMGHSEISKLSFVDQWRTGRLKKKKKKKGMLYCPGCLFYFGWHH